MQEFNYNRAWTEWAVPRFAKLKPEVRELLAMAATAAEKIGQNDNRALPWPKEGNLKSAFDKMDAETLREAATVVHLYGHWHPYNGEVQAIQADGLYWKFKMWADQSLIGRGEEASVTWERNNFRVAAFVDHKEGTEYDNEELGTKYSNAFAGVFEVKCNNVNHRVVLPGGSVDRTYKPHPFTIGMKHFPKDGGMYIDPHAAPCAYCGAPLESHKSDRVLFLKLLRDAQKQEINDLLKVFAEQMQHDHIDGVAFVKSQFQFKE